MHLVQCNLHLANCIEADRKIAKNNYFGVNFSNSLLMIPHCMLQLCQHVLFVILIFNTFKIPKFLSYDLCKNIIHTIITLRNDSYNIF